MTRTNFKQTNIATTGRLLSGLVLSPVRLIYDSTGCLTFVPRFGGGVRNIGAL